MPESITPLEILRAGDYLSRVRRLEEELSFKLQYLATLRTEMPAFAPHERVTGGDIADSTAHRAMRIQELSEEIEGLYNAIDHARKETQALLRLLPDPRVRGLLEMRYLSGYKWDTIADTMFVTPRSAMRMHRRALSTVYALLSDRRARGAK
ncbi:MAG: hypothetical protein II343_07665 [Clostridia bacterium]|nr:hypothetical protein [Clostridia bacterium]